MYLPFWLFEITWPNGRNGKPAKICVSFVINQEEGGERSVDEGDEAAETVLHEFGPVGHVSQTSYTALIFKIRADLHLTCSWSPSPELVTQRPR